LRAPTAERARFAPWRRARFPVRAMWNLLLAEDVFPHASIESLLCELPCNPNLQKTPASIPCRCNISHRCWLPPTADGHYTRGASGRSNMTVVASRSRFLAPSARRRPFGRVAPRARSCAPLGPAAPMCDDLRETATAQLILSYSPLVTVIGFHVTYQTTSLLLLGLSCKAVLTNAAAPATAHAPADPTTPNKLG